MHPECGDWSCTTGTLTGTMAVVDATSVTSAESVRSLARQVRERMDQLGLRQTTMASQGGPSPATIRSLFAAAEAGEPWKDLQSTTAAKFDRALRWEQGSTRDVLRGGRARPVPGSADVTLIHGHDISMGALHLVVPQEALDDLSATERAEAEAHLVAEFLAKIREFRASR